MKNPADLQRKLEAILAKMPTLKVLPNVPHPWSDLEMAEIAWVVQDYVNNTYGVIEDDDRLKDWLEEYRFHCASRK
jgi:hypothetical protein